MLRKFACTSAAVLSAAIAFSSLAHAADADPVVFTFSTVGDSRLDSVTNDPTQLPLTGQDAKWLNNTKVFSRMMRTIQSQKAQALFFNGDMIMGYGKAALPTTAAATPHDYIFSTDLGQFYVQYAFWRGMVAPAMENGTYIVPVPGNHETEVKANSKKAAVENENAWRDNMGDLVIDSTRWSNMGLPALSNFSAANNPSAPATASTDGITTDQSQLSYSFDIGDSHFAIINTDPVGKDAHAPTAWLSGDFAAAQSRGAHHYFVFGHKPAYTYYFNAGSSPLPSGAPSSLDSDIPARDAFWTVIENYHATYFCGHEHVFNASQPNAVNGGSAWQILVGSGGSPFDAKQTDATISPTTDRKYAWATVKIHQSGSINIDAYGFSDAYGPTQVLKSIVLPY